MHTFSNLASITLAMSSGLVSDVASLVVEEDKSLLPLTNMAITYMYRDPARIMVDAAVAMTLTSKIHLVGFPPQALSSFPGGNFTYLSIEIGFPVEANPAQDQERIDLYCNAKLAYTVSQVVVQVAIDPATTQYPQQRVESIIDSCTRCFYPTPVIIGEKPEVILRNAELFARIMKRSKTIGITYGLIEEYKTVYPPMTMILIAEKISRQFIGVQIIFLNSYWPTMLPDSFTSNVPGITPVTQGQIFNDLARYTQYQEAMFTVYFAELMDAASYDEQYVRKDIAYLNTIGIVDATNQLRFKV